MICVIRFGGGAAFEYCIQGDVHTFCIAQAATVWHCNKCLMEFMACNFEV